MSNITPLIKQSLSGARKPMFRFITPIGHEDHGYRRMGMPFIGVHKLGFYGNLIHTIPTFRELMDMDNTTYKTLAVVTHLAHREGVYEKLKPLHELGFKVIIDIDEYVWRWSSITAKDKKKFNETLSLADVITTNSPYLHKKIYEHCGRHAFIVPDTLPEEEFFPPIQHEEGERLRVLYTGTIKDKYEMSIVKEMVTATESFADWIMFRSVVRDKTKNFPMMVTPSEFNDLKNVQWQIPQEPQLFMRSAHAAKPHVAVAPLTCTFENNAKSDYKIIEAGALGIPCIAQNLKPYENFTYRVSSTESFIDTLKHMYDDESYREQVCVNTVKYAYDRRLQTAIYLGNLLGAYQNVLGEV